MENSDPIKFVDVDTGDACILVRFDASSVALGISLKSDGDIEAVMTKETARLVNCCPPGGHWSDSSGLDCYTEPLPAAWGAEDEITATNR